MLDLADLTPRPPSILFPLLSVRLSLCLSLVVGFFFFFFFLTAIWVDLMVVVGCGLWAVTVAVVVDCGGDGRWWLSVFFFFFFLQFGLI